MITDVGGRLRSWRRHAKLSQRDLAAKLERSQGWVSAMEREDQAVLLEHVVAWAAACGVDVQLVDNIQPPGVPPDSNLARLWRRLGRARAEELLANIASLPEQPMQAYIRLAAFAERVPLVLLEGTVAGWESFTRRDEH